MTDTCQPIPRISRHQPPPNPNVCRHDGRVVQFWAQPPDCYASTEEYAQYAAEMAASLKRLVAIIDSPWKSELTAPPEETSA